jgi:hypothetical protein
MSGLPRRRLLLKQSLCPSFLAINNSLPRACQRVEAVLADVFENLMNKPRFPLIIIYECVDVIYLLLKTLVESTLNLIFNCGDVLRGLELRINL